jgi:hypothetical protein
VTESGSERARVLARIVVIIIILAVNVFCIMAVFSLVDSGTATPNVYLAGFTYTNNHDDTAYVSVVGTVANPSSVTARNITVIVDVYIYYHRAPVTSRVLELGEIPGGSSRSFNADIPYAREDYVLFNGVDYGLLVESRFDFGLDFFAIVLPLAVLLPALDVYCACRLGLFGWISARKKVVATTVVWSAILALLIIIPYWLFYSGSHIETVFSTVGGLYPELYIWDVVLVFLVSVVAGAIIVNVETIVYSFVASLVLSSIFEVLYGSFFAWFSLGYGQSFSMIIPGLVFTTYLESIIAGVFFTILRMVNVIVPCFCVLGVIIGAVIRGYFEPSADS